MNLVEQIFQQANAGSANGQGFGQFFAEGVQSGQRQQSLDMQKQQLAMEIAQAPLKNTLLQQDADIKSAQLESLLHAKQVRVVGEQERAGLSQVVADALSSDVPKDVTPDFFRAFAKAPWLAEDSVTQKMFSDANASFGYKMELIRQKEAAKAANFTPGFGTAVNPKTGEVEAYWWQSPNNAQLVKPEKPVSQSTHEKDFAKMSELQDALAAANASGDPAAIAKAKRDVDTFGAMATPPTQTVYDPATGNPIFTTGKTASDLTVANQTNLQGALQSATTSIDVANRLEPLISSETVGVRAFAGSVLKDKLLAQFFPGVASQNRATAEVLSAQLRASTIKQLKSDGNISEKERQQILLAVPGINAPADSAEHARDLIQSARKVSAIQAVVSATKLKQPIPASAALALPWEEIVRLAKTGVLTPDQATAAYDAQLKARSQQ